MLIEAINALLPCLLLKDCSENLLGRIFGKFVPRTTLGITLVT